MPTLGWTKLNVNIGDEFGRLTVLGKRFRTLVGKSYAWFCVFQCGCGRVVAIQLTSVVRGNTNSCGCLRKENSSEMCGKLSYSHGLSRHPIYPVWSGMIDRCEDSTNDKYKFYGARGITVCKEWHDVHKFIKWAATHGWRRGLVIDRRNTFGNYEPSNCRFITQKENTRNRRNTFYITAFGETKPLTAWLEDRRCRVKDATLRFRMTTASRKWSPEGAITTPPTK